MKPPHENEAAEDARTEPAPGGCAAASGSAVELAAIAYVAARQDAGKAKVARRLCRCENEDSGDYSIGDFGTLPCWMQDKLSDEEICGPCKKRASLDPEYKRLTKEATKAWNNLKRTVLKQNTKLTGPKGPVQ